MSKKEYVLQTTEEKRQQMKKRGIDEDAIPAVGERRFRRVAPSRVAQRHEQKIKITMLIDADILDYFKNRASDPNAAPYQTQINNELRRVMTANSNENVSTTVSKTAHDFLNDESFLRALKEKLALV